MIVNSHHLIPVLADWSNPVRFDLTWDTEIDASLRGYEVRGAMRQWPRPLLTFTADINGAGKYHDLRARLTDALRIDHLEPGNTDGRTGRVCVPWAGRESWLTSVPASPATTLTFEANHHPWKANDWLIVFAEDESSWATAQIQSVAGTVATGQTVTLIAPITLPANSQSAIRSPQFVSPLFFGSLKSLPAEMSHDSPALAMIELSVAGDSYEPDAWPPAGDPEPPELPIAMFYFFGDCMEFGFDAIASEAGFGTTLVGYEWDFGDGDKAEGITVGHTYLHPGSYNVTLTVRDNLGRRSQLTQLASPIDCDGTSVGPDVPPPGDPPPNDPDGDPPDPPEPPPEPPDDDPPLPPPTPPLPPPTPPLPPEDYPIPPYPDYPLSSGEPIAPPGFGV